MQLTADELIQLGKSVRSVCDQLATEERIRAIAYAGDGTDTELWQVLTQQIGITAIPLTEAGSGALALGVVAHELGRALAPVPFLSSAVLAAGLLSEVPDPPVDTLAALAAGERTAAAVLGEDGAVWAAGARTITASRGGGGGWTLAGTARHVLGAMAAQDLVVVATPSSQSDEPAVFLLDADADGVTRKQERVLDPTRPMASVTFAASPARRISGPDSAAAISRAVYRSIAVLSAEQVGSHERVLELAVDYARTRQQFGRPIGSFQAIKHRCADMLVSLEWSRSASQAALEAAGNIPFGSAAELDWRANMAKAVCSEGLREAAHANLQIHGGIGFTWEDAAHLYLRRARTAEVVFGGPAAHWGQLRGEAGLL
ncbi:acyl-CoA dehydrogenase family protein [Mycolicibacterium sp. CH28]|uniref:acyl-CoA dehydrogenase family protein n=1 Tax=Mycolicibacterium sp. CH28 TaxID=2512237 RepID=UPI001F47CF91|nr:acyl-CoA dehydrogenase family protein [Mycolicibacterium sp. CH28]